MELCGINQDKRRSGKAEQQSDDAMAEEAETGLLILKRSLGDAITDIGLMKARNMTIPNITQEVTGRGERVFSRRARFHIHASCADFSP